MPLTPREAADLSLLARLVADARDRYSHHLATAHGARPDSPAGEHGRRLADEVKATASALREWIDAHTARPAARSRPPK